MFIEENAVLYLMDTATYFSATAFFDSDWESFG